MDDKLHTIFAKTEGRCFHCGKVLLFGAYGNVRGRGAWEVDHSNPVSRGGSGYLRNLVPACVRCNRSKGDRTSAEFGSGKFVSGAKVKPLIHPRKKLKNVRIDEVKKLPAAEQGRFWREFRTRWPGAWKRLLRVLGDN